MHGDINLNTAFTQGALRLQRTLFSREDDRSLLVGGYGSEAEEGAEDGSGWIQVEDEAVAEMDSNKDNAAIGVPSTQQGLDEWDNPNTMISGEGRGVAGRATSTDTLPQEPT